MIEEEFRLLRGCTYGGGDMLLDIIILTIASVQIHGVSLPGQNTPPILRLKNNWKIPANEEVGTRLESARTVDNEGDDLATYDIKPSQYLDGSKFFRIDSKSGDIYLNKSLKNESGNQYYLYVTANDGEFETKTEIFVEVLSEDGKVIQSIKPTSAPSSSKIPLSTGSIISNVVTLHPFLSQPVHQNVVDNGQRHNDRDDDDNKHNNDGNVSDSDDDDDDDSDESPLLAPNVERDGKSRDSSSVAAALVPLMVLAAVILLVSGGVWLFRQSRHRKTAASANDVKKKDKVERQESEETSNSNVQESEFVVGSIQRAESNKYEITEWETSEKDKEEDGGASPVDSKWEYPRHHLKILGILGEGCFGQVWKCEAQDIGGLPGTTTVAVKTLKENAGDREKHDFISELEVMKMLDPHPNIVRLVGACTERDPLFVIMEFVPHGKLQTYLRNSRAEHYYRNLHGSSKSLSSHDLTSFAHQVARGMEYLSSKGIIHRDLAARNVLVGNNKTCKVADFGFARDVVANRVYERKSEGRLPIRWMAPESLYDNIFTTKTDVWSFGVLMWEIVTLGSTPYPGMAASDVIKKVRDGYRLEKPDHCKRELYNIMYYCWDKDARERPSFVELAQTLENLLLVDVDYIELDKFPEHAYYNVVSLSGEKI